MGPIIYVLLQVTFLVFGKFFEKEEMQKNIKSHERKKLKMKTVSRVKTGREAKKTSKARMRKWGEGGFLSGTSFITSVSGFPNFFPL